MVDESAEWHHLDPGKLLLVEKNDVNAARAISYGRSGSDDYDEIGFRTLAASPVTGSGAIRTLDSAAYEAERSARRKEPPRLARLNEQSRALRHRPFTFMSNLAGSWSVDDEYYNLHLANGEEWVYLRADPPNFLVRDAVDYDVVAFRPHPNVSILGGYWLPLMRLIAEGCFLPMQAWREDLESSIRDDIFCMFISHRWLSPAHPDPQGAQAQSLAWQLVGSFVRAIDLASRRGLHTPRQAHRPSGMPLGIRGSRLEESLIVNVLRRHLDDDLLERAVEELQAFPEDLLRMGRTDTRLEELKRLLAGSPILRTLLAHIYLWYDFSCLPQEPRTPEDEIVFQDGLKKLQAIQVAGQTIVLLDDPGDYLSRAWCVLESDTAQRYVEMPHVIVGSRAVSAAAVDDQHFGALAGDRSHMLWRALLDTVVFRTQSLDECAVRMQLAVTDEGDLDYITRAMEVLPPPLDVHTDESEIVTGTMPLPVVEGQVVSARLTGWSRQAHEQGDRASLDWTTALSLDGWQGTVQPSFVAFAPGTKGSGRSCHIGVVASCEGEAVLLTDWVLEHRAELASTLAVEAVSLSWTAADALPVGHLHEGRLRSTPIESEVWVLVSTADRFAYCQIANFLKTSLAISGTAYAEVAVDRAADNIAWFSTEADLSQGHVVRLTNLELPEHDGGLFRYAIPEHLFPHAPVPSATSDPIQFAHRLAAEGWFAESQDVAFKVLEALGDQEDEEASWLRAQACSVVAVAAAQSGDLQQAIEYQWYTYAELKRLGNRLDARRVFEDIVQLEAGLEQPEGLLNRIRGDVVAAQALADSGAYAESNALLQPLIDDVSWTRHLAGAYIGKIWGLMGYNFYRMGEFEPAMSHTQKARKVCAEFEDPTGVHVYDTNLAFIAEQMRG